MTRSRVAITRLPRVGLVVALLMIVSCLGGCMEPFDPFEPYWHGELPLEERQTIEDFQSQVEPLGEEILTELEGLNIGDITRQDDSHLSDCSEVADLGEVETPAFQVWGAGFLGDPVDVDVAAALIEAIVIPAGFTTRTQAGDPSDVTIEWHNTQDGGFVSLLVVANSHTVVRYRSGCRPTNGATSDQVRDRVTPEWETRYPRRSEATDTKRSTTPPTTPAP